MQIEEMGNIMKKLKLRLLSFQYETELKNNNTTHIKDYIAVNSMLAGLKIFPVLGDGSQTLAKLIFPFESKSHTEYEVPTIAKLEKILEIRKKERDVFSAHQVEAATWLKLMIENEFISEGQIIDPNKFVMVDFVTDERLFRISGMDKLYGMDLANHTEFQETSKSK